MPFPDVCVDDRESCPNEWPVLLFNQETCSAQTVAIRNAQGEPIDLTERRVMVMVKETLNTKNLYFAIFCEIVDVTGGIVKVSLNETDTTRAGLFVGEFVVQEYIDETNAEASSSEESSEGSSSDDSFSPVTKVLDTSDTADVCTVFHRVPCYVEIRENLQHMNTKWRTLSIAEVRLSIRDKCREDNFLLDNVEFSDTEIVWALRRPVEFWNESLPPLGPSFTYDMTSFPYRYHWLIGTMGELMLLAAHHYRRNSMSYQAGGVSFQDKDTAAEYHATGERLRAEYKEWVFGQRRAINVSRAYARTEISSYGNAAYQSRSNF